MLFTGPTVGAAPVNGVQVAHVTESAPFVVFKYDMTRERCFTKKNIKLKGKNLIKK